MSRERDKNPLHVIALLRKIIAEYRKGGVNQISVDDLEQAVDNLEARHAR